MRGWECGGYFVVLSNPMITCSLVHVLNEIFLFFRKRKRKRKKKTRTGMPRASKK